jgi:hypothetical protein
MDIGRHRTLALRVVRPGISPLIWRAAALSADVSFPTRGDLKRVDEQDEDFAEDD